MQDSVTIRILCLYLINGGITNMDHYAWLFHEQVLGYDLRSSSLFSEHFTKLTLQCLALFQFCLYDLGILNIFIIINLLSLLCYLIFLYLVFKTVLQKSSLKLNLVYVDQSPMRVFSYHSSHLGLLNFLCPLDELHFHLKF